LNEGSFKGTMDTLNSVSETALITLRARVLEAQKEKPIIKDVMGVELVQKLKSLLPLDTRERIFDKKLSSVLTRHLAMRARKYDLYTRNFIKNNPDGLVVSLGCGFDTRYWRLSENTRNYIELDLPEVIEAKKALLANAVKYKMIGFSILEENWIREILAVKKKNVLFLAEGLFPYLPQYEVEKIFKKIAGSFSDSLIVFETVNKKYTKGIWKKMVVAKMKRALGTEAGASYEFGLSDAREIESYAKNIRVVDEWSYFEDKDIKPGFLRFFRNIKFMSRTQWTIKAEIGEKTP
jgi:methyltransferase (TIGR00027 family)